MHTVMAVLEHRPLHVLSVHARGKNATSMPNTPSWNALYTLTQRLGLPIQWQTSYPETELDGQREHASVWLRCRPWEMESEAAFWSAQNFQADADPALLVILDHISDPHNFGACLRTAAAARVHAVCVPVNQQCPLTATVVHTSCGAAAAIPCYAIVNLSRFIAQIKEKTACWVYGADVNASQSLYAINATGPTVWVMGAEDKGLRPSTQAACDQCFVIPMPGNMQSLNVSVATGIVLFETVRQRLAHTHPAGLEGRL